jgi:hypothetical protein
MAGQGAEEEDDAFAEAADQSARCKEKLSHAVFCVLEDEDQHLDETSFSRSFGNQLAELIWECAPPPHCCRCCNCSHLHDPSPAARGALYGFPANEVCMRSARCLIMCTRQDKSSALVAASFAAASTCALTASVPFATFFPSRA